MRLRGGLPLVFALVSAAAAGAQETPTAPVWLPGCWVAGSGDTRTEELWTDPGGGILLGLSRTLRPDRPAAWEFLRLESGPEGWVYHASPGGRPATAFPVVSVTPDRFRAELPTHDFPRALEYRRTGADSLVALVYGEVAADAHPAFVLRFARGACPGVAAGTGG